MMVNKTNLRNQVQTRIDGLTGTETLKDLLVLNKSAQGLNLYTQPLINAIQTKIDGLSASSQEKDLLLSAVLSSSQPDEPTPLNGLVNLAPGLPNIYESPTGAVYIKTGVLDDDVEKYPLQETRLYSQTLNEFTVQENSYNRNPEAVWFQDGEIWIADRLYEYISRGVEGDPYQGIVINVGKDPYSICVVDNKIWVKSYSSSNVYLTSYDLSTKAQLNEITLTTNYYDRVFEIDGQLWSSDSANNALSRLDPNDANSVLETKIMPFSFGSHTTAFKFNERYYINENGLLTEIDWPTGEKTSNSINVPERQGYVANGSLFLLNPYSTNTIEEIKLFYAVGQPNRSYDSMGNVLYKRVK